MFYLGGLTFDLGLPTPDCIFAVSQLIYLDMVILAMVMMC